MNTFLAYYGKCKLFHVKAASNVVDRAWRKKGNNDSEQTNGCLDFSDVALLLVALAQHRRFYHAK